MGLIVEPTKLSDKISRETVSATVQLLERRLRALDFEGRWGLTFSRPVKRKDSEELEVIRPDGESLLIITKPGDVSTCWECNLVPPMAYTIIQAIFSIQTEQKVPRPRILDMIDDLRSLQKKTDNGPVASLSISSDWAISHNEVLERGLVAASYVLHHEKGGTKDNVTEVVAQELSLRSWIKKTNFKGRDTAAQKIRRAAVAIILVLYEKNYLEGEVIVKITTAGRDLIDGLLDQLSDKVKAKLHRGLGENPEKAEAEAAEAEAKAEAKAKIEAETKAKAEAEEAKAKAEAEAKAKAEAESKAKTKEEERAKKRAEVDPSKLDNEALRIKLTSLVAEHDRLVKSQEEIEEEIEALKSKRQDQDRIIEESHKKVEEKDAQIEKLGEEITWFENNIEECEAAKRSIDKEIKDYENVNLDETKKLEKIRKKIQKAMK